MRSCSHVFCHCAQLNGGVRFQLAQTDWGEGGQSKDTGLLAGNTHLIATGAPLGFECSGVGCLELGFFVPGYVELSAACRGLQGLRPARMAEEGGNGGGLRGD